VQRFLRANLDRKRRI